jgi:hypothetical protein
LPAVHSKFSASIAVLQKSYLEKYFIKNYETGPALGIQINYL